MENMMTENETKQSKYLVEDFEVFDARDILNASTYGLMSLCKYNYPSYDSEYFLEK